MIYFPFFIQRFESETKPIGFLETAAHLRLLTRFLDQESPLEKTKLVLYSVTNAQSKSERAAVRSVLKKLWTETPEGWVHLPSLVLLERMRVRREASRANGKRGGRPSKAETQSVIDAARLEHVPGNPLGSENCLEDDPESKPTRFSLDAKNENLDGSHNKRKDKTKSNARDSVPVSRPRHAAVRAGLQGEGLPDAAPQRALPVDQPTVVAREKRNAPGDPEPGLPNVRGMLG